MSLFALVWGSLPLASVARAEQGGHVYSDKIEALLQSPTRPTVAEIKQAFDPWPEQNPIHEDDHGHPPSLFERELAGYIAQMEHAYPGLIYAPLGRDVIGFSDLVDAFYRAQGQPGRVRRLNASRGTFYSASDEQLVHFLKSSGFDIDHALSRPPFIVFDHTTYNNGSQSTRLIHAGYKYFLREHPQDAAAFVHKFNLISTYAGTPITPELDLKDFFKAREDYINGLNGELPDRVFEKVLVVSPMADQGTITYSKWGEWHDSFGPFRDIGEGRISGELGTQSDRKTKVGILASLYEMIKRVETPEFRALVDKEAEGLGFRFNPAGSPDACQHVFGLSG